MKKKKEHQKNYTERFPPQCEVGKFPRVGAAR